ncbi:hypothetical protein V494_01961 [Pseudogymnoascus sp. VKM F-4513 (FW-928)]|nr:hypothetical protein V494_01961 [Pseudogymnoascus sp. VKM F-4513 (FW-928)]
MTTSKPRRALEAGELFGISSRQPSVARPPTGVTNSLQSGRSTLSTQIQFAGPDSILSDQNHSLNSPGPSFPQANQQYQDPWGARGSETYYRFEHFHSLDARRHSQQTTQLQVGAGVRAKMDVIKTSPPTKTCSICLDKFSGQDLLDSNFPYSLPLSVVVHLLSKDQVDLYKAKFEEWRTPSRFYCPVSTCSTFMPPRLIREGSRQMKIKQISLGYLALQSQNENLDPREEQTTSSSFHEKYFAKKDIDANPTNAVSSLTTALSVTMCPKCAVTICTRCRQLQHPEAPCPQTDLEPLLAAQLDKWKIKRCPKCRAGVRRMFGCAHIECRCGAHFCFACLEPINKCDGQCDENRFNGDDDDMSGDEWDSEDIDALEARNGTELDLGEEPYNPAVDTWGCNHSFKPIYKFHGYLSNGKILSPRKPNDASLDCQVCWKVISPHLPHLPPTNAGNLGYNVKDLTSFLGVASKPRWMPMTVDGKPAWMCMGKHLLCYSCPRDTMLDAETSKYRCECSAYCPKCEKVNQGEGTQLDEEVEIKDIDLAYDCDCEMIVCGECKVNLEDELVES